MAIAATAIKAAFGRSYKGVDDAYFYTLLNQVDKLLVRHFGLRKKPLYLPVTASIGTVSLAEGALWIESARWVDKPAETPLNLGGWPLCDSNVDEKDTDGGDWRANKPGTPSEFLQTHDMAGGLLQLDCPPNQTTLIALAATNATPIVVTASADHGLSDGDRVDIRNALGNTAANGDFYAKVTGYASNEFALYSDQALSVPVAGNGSYTASSALISCHGSPFLQVFSRWHEPLSSGSNLPETPMYPDIYTDGCCFLYAKRHAHDDVPKYKALFDDVIAQQVILTQQRAGRKPMRVRVVQQRDQGFVRSRW